MAIVRVSIVPLGTGSPSLSKYVTRAVKVVRDHGDIHCELTSMGTILEGDLDQILKVIREMHETVFAADVQRVLTSITIDDRRDKPVKMEDKIRSVENKLRECR